jgi:hypothetical protein
VAVVRNSPYAQNSPRSSRREDRTAGVIMRTNRNADAAQTVDRVDSGSLEATEFCHDRVGFPVPGDMRVQEQG